METFTKFLYDFLGQFFSGVITMFKGIGNGIKQAVDVKSYTSIINNYKGDFSMPEWILVAIAVGLILMLFVLIRTSYFLYNKKIWKSA